ncbi:MAG: Lrp/AsnC ligand binding domain-containing protein [Candidatus Bathyarchaeota archaeon]
MKIDETDVYILKALLENGRETYRAIAKSLAVSTPTIEARIRRMKETGLIRKFVPILNADMLGENITVIVMANADFQNIDQISEALGKFDEVREAFLASGEHNLMLKIAVYDVEELQDFTQKLTQVPGVRLSSSYVVTKTLKEEQRARLRPGMRLRMRCEKCKAEIKGEPITVKIGDRTRFFCCKVCAGTYP